ncbi:IclR family transcriptional regulator [Ilumatobacter sp.]|uniref:IclR family transcriptional regulator n=1 Tax=Ilumatobacter sp. TaxID=1967498 RepID=UPI003C6B079E
MATTTTATGDATADETGVPRSINRVLDLFEIVLAERNCNLTAAASAAGLTPTTALRYLRALEARGYVDRDEAGDFSAGPTILRITASLRGGTVLDRLAATAQPHLERLAEHTGESSYLAVSDGRTGTYIATAESPRAIRHVGWIGQNVTLDGSALGAALEAPGTTVTRTGAIEADITAISRALPPNGKLGLAISIVGPEHRFSDDIRVAHDAEICATVDALTHELRTNGEDFTS